MCYLCPTVCSTSSVCVSKSLHSRNECWRNRMLSADMCHSVIGATHPAGCCRHTGAQTNFTLTNTNIQQTHTPKYTHTHTQTLRSARITVRAVRTSWLSNPWTCANNFLSPGKGEGRRSKIKKITEDDGDDTICLFIWNIFTEGKRVKEKRLVYPSVL